MARSWPPASVFPRRVQGGESSVAVGEDGVWFLTAGGHPQLKKIDPTTKPAGFTRRVPARQ